MSCKKLTQKKYITRPGPPFSATDCPNEIQKGNNGKTYKSVKNKKGIYQWKPHSSSNNASKLMPKGGKTYMIHDNRSNPYSVNINGNKVVVFRNQYNEDTQKYVMDKKVLELVADKIFIGDDPLHASMNWAPNYKGNSILVKSGNKYIYIGDKIFSFEPKEEITAYYSPVGNNDVPYPYAVSDNHTYLILENIILDNMALDLAKDAYEQYYESMGSEDEKAKMSKASKPMKTKIIHNHRNKKYQ